MFLMARKETCVVLKMIKRLKEVFENVDANTKPKASGLHTTLAIPWFDLKSLIYIFSTNHTFFPNFFQSTEQIDILDKYSNSLYSMGSTMR